jgi:hypothetical protein
LYFNEGFSFSLKMKASHLTSYFDKLSLASYFGEAFFDFVFRRRSLWLRILMKASLG